MNEDFTPDCPYDDTPMILRKARFVYQPANPSLEDEDCGLYDAWVCPTCCEIVFPEESAFAIEDYLVENERVWRKAPCPDCMCYANQGNDGRWFCGCCEHDIEMTELKGKKCYDFPINVLEREE